MNDLKIWKATTEIRYPASASIFDNRGRIASKWQWTTDLSEWRISNNDVTIHNKSLTSSFRAGYQNAAVIMEQPANIKEYAKQASDFLSSTLEILCVSKITRIGFRVLQIAERKHFKLLKNKIKEQIYSISDEAWNSLGGNPEDLALNLTLDLGEYKANFLLGPMQKEQLSDFFESIDTKEKLPAVSLFLDFDIYNNNPGWSPNSYGTELAKFIEQGIETIKTISDNFLTINKGFV